MGLSRQSVTIYASRLKNSTHSFEALRQLKDSDLSSLVYAPPVVVSLCENARRRGLDCRMHSFLSELKRTGVTCRLLWEEYRKESQDPFRCTQFCILLKQARKTYDASMHLVHTPAAMVMIDFSGDKMSYVVRSSGEIIACPVLVAVLPFSKYTFVRVLRDASIPQVIKALNACLAYFSGAPLSLKTDNMKQVVIKSCRYEPLFTEALKQWSIHYNITLLATRVENPRTGFVTSIMTVHINFLLVDITIIMAYHGEGCHAKTFGQNGFMAFFNDTDGNIMALHSNT